MDILYVLDIFITFSNISNSDSKKFQPLVEISINNVLSKLNQDVSSLSDDDIQTLSFFCAACAFYSFTLIQVSSSPSTFKLSELSLSVDSSKYILSARTLRDNFLNLASHLIVDDNFFFQQVH